MNERQLNILTSPAFILALCLLLANDFLFKPTLNNSLTGKLSDFTGLFIFPLFWVALFPQLRKIIYVFTGFLFVFWKSEHSQPLITSWNNLELFPVFRTVDITDLIALLILPFSYLYSCAQRQTSYRFAPFVVAVISLVAFTATSYRSKFEYDNKFYFPDSTIHLTRKLYHVTHVNPEYRVQPCVPSLSSPNNIGLEIPSDFCFTYVDAEVSVSQEQGQSVVTLKKMEHQCPEGSDDKAKLLAIFEAGLIAKLKQVNIASSPPVTTATAEPFARPDLNEAGQLYFVSIGELPQVNIERLANYFGRKYGVQIRTLASLAITDEMRQPGFPNTRPVADKVIRVLKREKATVAFNSKAIVIAIIEDMNVTDSKRRYDFSYQLDERFALVALESIRPTTFCEPANQDLLESRLRKVIAKNIGFLYYRLPRSERPASVMYSSVDCVDELDQMGEEF
jgi:hypothetical protein